MDADRSEGAGSLFGAVEVITLFVDELHACRRFYADVFGVRFVYEDAVSAVFRLGPLMVNLLQASEAPELIEPQQPMKGTSSLLTLRVPDADAACAELQRRGVKLLNGPIDRPWKRRTAAFADPSGHVWEIAQVL